MLEKNLTNNSSDYCLNSEIQQRKMYSIGMIQGNKDYAIVGLLDQMFQQERAARVSVFKNQTRILFSSIYTLLFT